MDLTKEAIDKIEDLVNQSVVAEVDGKKMSTRALNLLLLRRLPIP